MKGDEGTSWDDEGIKTRLLNQETTKERKTQRDQGGRGACKSLERSEGLGKSIAAASEHGGGSSFAAGKRKETRRERAKRKF